jgi:hypothetical protein
MRSVLPTSLAFLAGLLFLSSCSNSRRGPDVSDIQVDLKVERFEQDFFRLDTNRLSEGLVELGKKYPHFATLYFNDLLLIPDISANNGALQVGPSGQEVVRMMLRSYRWLYDSLQTKYKGMADVEEQIEDGLKHVKYYYPQYAVPGLITFIADLKAPGAIITPNYIGIGLQQYAGKRFTAYDDPEIRTEYPEFITRRFDKEYIAANSLRSVVDDIYPDKSESSSLIEQMVEKGKQWYLLDLFLPDAHDSVKTFYTGKQLDWCEENEGNIWSAFLRNNPDVYTIDIRNIQEYVGENPTTQTIMPGNSPGNIGQWLGWRIVKKFAESNPKLTPQQVLATPARDLFQQARYRPK